MTRLHAGVPTSQGLALRWTVLLGACAEREPPEGFLASCDTGRPCPADLVCEVGSPLFSNPSTIRCDDDDDRPIEGHDDWYGIDAFAGRPAVCVPETLRIAALGFVE